MQDTTARQPDRKRDSEQMAAGSTDDQLAASSTNEPDDKSETGTAAIWSALKGDTAWAEYHMQIKTCLHKPQNY